MHNRILGESEQKNPEMSSLPQENIHVLPKIWVKRLSRINRQAHQILQFPVLQAEPIGFNIYILKLSINK